tara:strand:- start:90429 stop:90914 length:486 start_codon:yes stop_codon:yes gene_type:complete
MISTIIQIAILNALLAFQEPIWNGSETLSIIPAAQWVNKSEEGELSLKKYANSSLRGVISITESVTRGRDLNELWKEYVEDAFPEAFDNYKMIEKGERVVDTHDAKYILFKYSDMNIEFQSMSTVFIKGDKLFIISCASTTSYYKTVERDFVKMIDSIKLK